MENHNLELIEKIEGDGEDAVKLVEKAIEGLGANLDEKIAGLKLDDRFSAIEKKLADVAVKAQRPGRVEKTNDEAAQEYLKAFQQYLVHGDKADREFLKTLTASDQPGTGYFAPPEMTNDWIRNLVQFSPIRALVTARSTTAPSIVLPTRTAVTNATWANENEADTSSEPAFGQKEIPVNVLKTYVPISNILLQDAAAVQAEVNLALAEDFGKKEATAFLKGAGAKAPEGILANTAVLANFKPSGNASTLGSAPADLLIDLIYSLPAAYRANGAFLMSGSTIAAIRKLKDSSSGQYLWQAPLQSGQPATLLGYPLYEAVDMDDVGAGKLPIVFADFGSLYRIVDRAELSILVDPYSQGGNDITLFRARRRVGGAVVNPAAITGIKVSAS